MKSTNPFKDHSLYLSKALLLPLLPIALFPIVFLCLHFYPLSLSLSLTPSTTKPPHSSLSTSPPPSYSVAEKEKQKAYYNSCDYFNGKWIKDKRGPLYNGTTCVTIKESHNCIINGRPDINYLYWRWKPNECYLPRFEPNTFLQLSKNKHIAFVGDSLARNQLESLLCMLTTISKPILLHHKGSRWWHFPSHNATLSSYWSPFLVKGVERSKNGPSYNTMYLDHVHEKFEKDMDKFDLIVLSFGNWFLVPSVYYQGDSVIGCFNFNTPNHIPNLNYTDIGFYGPLRKALRTTLNRIIERKVGKGKNGVGVIVRTFSPSHFEGDWDKAGICSKSEPYENGEKQIGEMDGVIRFRRIEIEEVENAKIKAKEFGGLKIEVLDVTKLALLRPDGHPGAYMNAFPFSNGNRENVQNDCVHWCLPGPIDTWNEIFLEMMKKWKEQPRSEE